MHCDCDKLMYCPEIGCYECPVCNKLYRAELLSEETMREILR